MGGAIAILLAEEMGGKIKSLSNAKGNLLPSDSTMPRRMSSVSFKAFSDRLLVRLKCELLSSRDKGMVSWARMMEKSDPLALYMSAKSLLSWSDTGKLLEKFIGSKEKKAYFYDDSNSGMDVLGKLDGVHALSNPLFRSFHDDQQSICILQECCRIHILKIAVLFRYNPCVYSTSSNPCLEMQSLLGARVSSKCFAAPSYRQSQHPTCTYTRHILSCLQRVPSLRHSSHPSGVLGTIPLTALPICSHVIQSCTYGLKVINICSTSAYS